MPDVFNSIPFPIAEPFGETREKESFVLRTVDRGKNIMLKREFKSQHFYKRKSTHFPSDRMGKEVEKNFPFVLSTFSSFPSRTEFEIRKKKEEQTFPSISLHQPNQLQAILPHIFSPNLNPPPLPTRPSFPSNPSSSFISLWQVSLLRTCSCSSREEGRKEDIGSEEGCVAVTAVLQVLNSPIFRIFFTSFSHGVRTKCRIIKKSFFKSLSKPSFSLIPLKRQCGATPLPPKMG